MRHTLFVCQEQEEQEGYEEEDQNSSNDDIEQDSYVDDIEVVLSPDDLHKRSNFEPLDQQQRRDSSSLASSAIAINEEGEEETITKTRNGTTTATSAPNKYKSGKNNSLKQELEVYHTIISRSIHYIHMTFEQLDSIRSDINPFTGQLLVPDRLLKDALWQQISLRSKIENANERDTALDLTVSGTQYEEDNEEEEDDTSVSLLLLRPPPLQPIPSDDMTTYTGESTFLWTTSGSTVVPEVPKLRPSAQPSITNKRSSSSSAQSAELLNNKDTANKQYALYPSFRFSVEFTDFATLKHNVRVYSKTIFYAG